MGVSVMPRRGDHAHAGQSPGSYWLKWHVSDAQKRDCVRRRQPREIRNVEVVKLEYFREQYAPARAGMRAVLRSENAVKQRTSAYLVNWSSSNML